MLQQWSDEDRDSAIYESKHFGEAARKFGARAVREASLAALGFPIEMAYTASEVGTILNYLERMK